MVQPLALCFARNFLGLALCWLFRRLFLSKKLRLSPNSKFYTRDAHPNLVFLHFPRLFDLSLFFLN